MYQINSFPPTFLQLVSHCRLGLTMIQEESCYDCMKFWQDVSGKERFFRQRNYDTHINSTLAWAFKTYVLIIKSKMIEFLDTLTFHTFILKTLSYRC